MIISKWNKTLKEEVEELLKLKTQQVKNLECIFNISKNYHPNILEEITVIDSSADENKESVILKPLT